MRFCELRWVSQANWAIRIGRQKNRRYSTAEATDRHTHAYVYDASCVKKSEARTHERRRFSAVALPPKHQFIFIFYFRREEIRLGAGRRQKIFAVRASTPLIFSHSSHHARTRACVDPWPPGSSNSSAIAANPYCINQMKTAADELELILSSYYLQRKQKKINSQNRVPNIIV